MNRDGGDGEEVEDGPDSFGEQGYVGVAQTNDDDAGKP
jgi:hypothetical protein